MSFPVSWIITYSVNLKVVAHKLSYANSQAIFECENRNVAIISGIQISFNVRHYKSRSIPSKIVYC